MTLPHWSRVKELISGFTHRVREDRLTLYAGSMAYTTLLSLVPLVAVLFALFSAFPGFEALKQDIQQFLFNNLVPTASDVIARQVQGFAANAARMSAVGVLALVVVALLLISSVDRTINQIFRVGQGRRWSVAFAIYWSVLTLGPLLMGVSLALTSYVVSLELFQDGALSALRGYLIQLAPMVASWLAFLVLYLLVPNMRVRVKHAMAGAVLAAILFEISKEIFAFYVTSFPSYQAIYGALAAVPILFVWIYLCWLIVLLGAELTAYLGEVEKQQQREEPLDADAVS
ncbi:virulence factor BrkB family protein [Gallaecimonas sp. GXIMD4217]|uniref:virulence factor BrkB family protein n=1 Tax=Gallaecimonas sp. GXIMD4217 TaxID=3131927 RepID=UPI00311B281B